jgi:hypothetical protein
MRKHFDARSLEWFMGIYLIFWGAYVLLHPGMFQGNVIFHGFLKLFPQEFWGLGAFAVGGIRLVALFINGQWELTPVIRVVTSFLSVFVWFWVCVGLIGANEPQTGLIIYPGFVLADMFSAFRAASDAYEAEAMKRLKQLSEKPNVANITGRR